MHLHANELIHADRLRSYLSEGDLAVLILINLFDHLLQADVRLRNAEFLHHDFQLVEVERLIAIGVVSRAGEQMNIIDAHVVRSLVECLH